MKSIFANEIVANIPIAIRSTKNGFLEWINNYLLSFKKIETLEIVVPKNVYIRTRLICDYIEDSLEVSFQVSNFLMLLYIEFLQNSIKTYNPLLIHNAITRTHSYEDKLLIHANDRIYTYSKQETKHTVLTITIDKKEAMQGRLLLEEIDAIYGQAPCLEKMIATLWINFIEDYKTGHPGNSIQSIIKLLEKHFDK